MNAFFSKLFSDNRKPVLSKAEGSETSPDLCRRIKNRKLVVVLALAFSLCEAVADAQQKEKIFRVGILDPSTASGSEVLLGVFRQELSKLGWVEGKNITIEYRFADQKIERLPDLATELVRLKVDLIVTGGARATSSVKDTH